MRDGHAERLKAKGRSLKENEEHNERQFEKLIKDKYPNISNKGWA